MKMKIRILFSIFLFGCTHSLHAAVTINECREAAHVSYPNATVPILSKDSALWAKQHKVDLTVASGDFDDDGQVDVALLLNPQPKASKYIIAVCLSSRVNATPLYLERISTRSTIGVSKKGLEYEDLETNIDSKYPRDGIAVGCCESSGSTYIFENGSFRRIKDSD